jgi:uncharacterized membrane protein
MNSYLLKSLSKARRLIIAVIGFTVLFIGMALLVLPGPAIIVIPVGLTILATEFVWARTILKKVKNGMRSISEGIKK